MPGGKVLFMMGCPEIPIQTSIALYLSHKLTNLGFAVTVAGTDAATKLLKASLFRWLLCKKVGEPR